MDDKPKRNLRRRAPQTVRERSEKAQNAQPKRRIVSKTATGISKPFVWLGKKIATILRPFRFILWPFKTKPVRFVGRVLAAILLLKYFRNSWRELKQVTWPDRRETWQLTFAVFMFAIIFGIIITAVDFGLDRLFKQLILK